LQQQSIHCAPLTAKDALASSLNFFHVFGEPWSYTKPGSLNFLEMWVSGHIPGLTTGAHLALILRTMQHWFVVCTEMKCICAGNVFGS
jgi:hypothetical protein